MVSLSRALVLAIVQLGDPAILKVLAKTAVVTLLVFAAGGTALYVALDSAIGTAFGIEAAGLGALAAAVATVLAAWFLFRVVALFVLQFFVEDVVRAVEQRHYPQAAANARRIGFGEELGHALRSLGRTLVANALALPVAGLLLFTGVGAAAVFLVVNALLVGRELHDAVWLPHRAHAAEAAPIGGATRFLLGAVVVTLLAIPFLNLLAPILGAASATHLVHRAREKGPHA
tara:strand:- start:1393 stop:2085 length:693 start_codon:yes stop_codon:yes gene_type:complete